MTQRLRTIPREGRMPDSVLSDEFKKNTRSVTVIIATTSGEPDFESWFFKNNFHCPTCSKEDVWVKDGWMNPMFGPKHICASCGAFFSIQPFDPLPLADYVKEEKERNRELAELAIETAKRRQRIIDAIRATFQTP